MAGWLKSFLAVHQQRPINPLHRRSDEPVSLMALNVAEKGMARPRGGILHMSLTMTGMRLG
jgi:hypothetical protein